MEISDAEHVSKPTDVTVSRFSDISISNSPLGFSIVNESCKNLELDILVNNEPKKSSDFISENSVTDFICINVNKESLKSKEKSQLIISTVNSDHHDSASIPSGKSSMSKANEDDSNTKESILVMSKEQNKVQISVDTDKSLSDIDKTSPSYNDNIEISKKCISKLTFLGHTKLTDDKRFDEKIDDKEKVNNGEKWNIQEEQDRQDKEQKSCPGKIEKSHKAVDIKQRSLEISDSVLGASSMDDKNSSFSETSAEKTEFEEKTLSQDMCLLIKKVADYNEHLTHMDYSDSQPGSSHLTDNNIKVKGQGYSMADAVGWDHDTEKNTNSKQHCREIKQPVIKLVDFRLAKSIKTNREDNKLPNKSQRSWDVKLTAPVASPSRMESGKHDKEEISYEEFINQRILSEKKRNKKQRLEEEMRKFNKLKKEQNTADERQLESTNEAPVIQAKDGFSLSGVLSEIDSTESIASSRASCPQIHANHNGEEINMSKHDAVNKNMQNESDVQQYSTVLTFNPNSSIHATMKKKIATGTFDIVPFDGKIPKIALHKTNNAGHLSNDSQMLYKNKIAKLRTDVSSGFSGTYSTLHEIPSQAEKRMTKYSAALGRKKRNRSYIVSVDGKVPIIKLQRIKPVVKQEKGDMPMNINSFKESSDRKLKKKNLPNQGKSEFNNRHPSLSEQLEMHFETSCFESEEEDNLVSEDLLDSLLEKVTVDNGLKCGSELNILKEDNKIDGDSTLKVNFESGRFKSELGGTIANLSPIATSSILGHCFNYVTEQEITARIKKSDTDLQKKKSDIESCSSDSNHYNSIQKMTAENSSHQYEQQNMTWNDNSKDLLPNDRVDPEVEVLIRKLKYSDNKKMKNLKPFVLLTRIDEKHINLADASHLNFSRKKQKGKPQKQVEFKSPCDSSWTHVPLEQLDSPIKTGNTSQQPTDEKRKNKSSFCNYKLEESIKVEVHASWCEMDNDISGDNINFESSPSPSKKIRKDQELNNEVTEETNKKSLHSAGVKDKNIHENVWNLKPDNLAVNCATCAYLSSADSRPIKEIYAGKDILSRHVTVAIQRLDSKTNCTSLSSLDIKEDKIQRKKQAQVKKRFKGNNKIRCLTEIKHDIKSNDENTIVEARATGSETEDAKSVVVKINKLTTKKEELSLKDLSLPKRKHDNQGKRVDLSSEADISIYASRVKLEKLDMENTTHLFNLKLTHQDSSYFNSAAFNGESGPSSDGFTIENDEDHCVTTDSANSLFNKVNYNKQYSAASWETLLQLPNAAAAGEMTNLSSKNQTGVISLPGSDTEFTKTRENSSMISDQKTGHKEWYTMESEPESDTTTSPSPPFVNEDVKNLHQGLNTNTDSIGPPFTSCPKMSQVTDSMDKYDSYTDNSLSATGDAQDVNQRKKLLEAYKRRLDTVQDKDYEYEDLRSLKETQVRSTLSFSDDIEGHKIRPGVIILDASEAGDLFRTLFPDNTIPKDYRILERKQWLLLMN